VNTCYKDSLQTISKYLNYLVTCALTVLDFLCNMTCSLISLEFVFENCVNNYVVTLYIRNRPEDSGGPTRKRSFILTALILIHQMI